MFDPISDGAMGHQLLTDDAYRIIRMIPGDVVELMKHYQLYLAGGAIRAIITGEELSDWDLFGPDAVKLKLHAQSLVGSRAPGARLWSTKYAYTVLSNNRKPVQFIKRWLYDHPNHLVNDFDFTICSAAIWWQDERWHTKCHPAFYPDLAGKRLRYMSPTRQEDAGGSILRVTKFLKRGYSIAPEDLAKVMARITMRMRESAMTTDETGHIKVITGLLREVDPLTVVEGLSIIDPTGTDEPTLEKAT